MALQNTSALKIIRRTGLGLFLIAFAVFVVSITLGHHRLTQKDFDAVVTDTSHAAAFRAEVAGMIGRRYATPFGFVADVNAAIDRVNARAEGKQDAWKYQINSYKANDYRLELSRASSAGTVRDNALVFLLLTVGLGVIGALMYGLPQLRLDSAGIRNTNIVRNPATARGWIGIVLGVFLIAFYIVLYKYPEYIVHWVEILDPVSLALSGSKATQWFMYGFLYTVAVLVMGVRFMIRYRHSRYQLARTASVMFFQTCFAFLIPQALQALNKPAADLKNMWPLDYTFFFDWHIDQLIKDGTFGVFLLVWGIVLFAIGVPVLTYFFGKRWYCSWVCGCGGLAETLGDPFRQLSDKSVKAWRVERWVVHGVLAFAVVMTAAVVYTYFSGAPKILFIDSFKVREAYGFAIGFAFAGVVGTGFYPLMGSRVWCRFGCPLAAYLGIVQRFRSRFRITTNGGQCISCGNCSAYCEMGIDVRAYAQRGEDVVRASCVGCGVCASVCPRGVLSLENGPAAGRLVHITVPPM